MTAKLTSTGVEFGDGTSQTTALKSTGVSAGSYGSASAIPTLTINANGQVTSAGTAAVSVPNNCTNCSSYISLTNKPSIPNNCSNCSGDVTGGIANNSTGNPSYNSYSSSSSTAFPIRAFNTPGPNIAYRQISSNCGDFQKAGNWETYDSGTTIGVRVARVNCTNCNCLC